MRAFHSDTPSLTCGKYLPGVVYATAQAVPPAARRAQRAAAWRFHELDAPPGIGGAEFRILNRDRLCDAVLDFFDRHRRRNHLAAIVHADFGLPPHNVPFASDARPYLLLAKRDADARVVAVLPADGDLLAYYGARPVDEATARDAFHRLGGMAIASRTIALWRAAA